MGKNYDWVEVWNKPSVKNKKDHIEGKEENYQIIKEHLQTPPKKMLEIGCGLARESEWFQKDYGTELWLLDGDKSDNKPKKRNRYYHWGKKEEFAFYNTIAQLKESYDSRDMTYRFVDANNIDIPEDETFDLICSFKSCGFHYPISEYAELIKKHSNENTVLLFDIRKEQLENHKEYLNVETIIHNGKKHHLCQIKLF